MAKLKKIAILIPAYNEEGNLLILYSKLKEIALKLKSYKFQYIIVDDGSKDNTVKIASEMAKKDKSFTLIELSRNFGKEIALTAGIDHIESDAVIIMDADMQHPPEIIPEFINKWEEGYEIVATKRISIEKRSFIKRIGSYLFYKLLNTISDIQMVSQTTDFRLLDKKAIQALKSFKEKNRMVRGIIDWMGFKKIYIEFNAPERLSGSASYSYRKLIGLAINSFTSFSLLPLRLTGYLGIIIFIIFGFFLIYMITDKFLWNYSNFSALSYVIVANTLLISIVLIALGLISLYIGNIHVEVLNRPLYIVRRKIN